MTAVVEKIPARQRLLDAANELFYAEGIHTVGIDRIIEAAGVAKASLYNTFGSKEELVAAYLETRKQRRQVYLDKHLELADTPRKKLLAVFDAQAELLNNLSFRGCAFINARAEGEPNERINQLCDDYRGTVRDLFAKYVREAGIKQQKLITDQLVLLYDGAVIGRQMDNNRKSSVLAKEMAAALIDQAIPDGAA
jgi:AcrR family transcriptional regulator